MCTQVPYKHCEFCNELFTPHPKVGERQRACFKESCKEQRKRQNQANWVKANPGYFKGRYPQLKEQILNNQAKKRSSKKHPNQVHSYCIAAIQDELSVYNNNMLLNCNRVVTAIQDQLTQIITNSNQQLASAIVNDYTRRVNQHKFKEVITL